MNPKQKAKILLVDDNPANIIALEAVLSAPQYELIEAESGIKAVKLCEQDEFALIVLDVQMPKMDGYETARRIKETVNKDTPIIFVTAVFHDDPFVRRGFEAGAIDYFGKPFDPDILKAKVSIYTELYLRTKRLAETEKLLATHAQIKTLLNAMPVGVIIADASGRIYESNHEASRIWGEVRNLRIEEFQEYKGWYAESGKPLHSHDWAMARALEKGESTKDELIDIETFTGDKKRILNSAYPIRGKQGQILGAVVVIQDVSLRQEIAEGLQHKIRDLLKDTEHLYDPSYHG